jgi:hypothetical protein
MPPGTVVYVLEGDRSALTRQREPEENIPHLLAHKETFVMAVQAEGKNPKKRGVLLLDAAKGCWDEASGAFKGKRSAKWREWWGTKGQT